MGILVERCVGSIGAQRRHPTQTWYWTPQFSSQIEKSDLGFGVGVTIKVVIVGREFQEGFPEQVGKLVELGLEEWVRF
jgi:hypothetical protein